MPKVVKIMHTSDLHLGITFNVLGKQSKLHRRDCEAVFSNIVDLCIKEKVAAFLIAGDLFDMPQPPKTLVKFVASELEKLKGEGINVFISCGNHDPYKKGSLWFDCKFPSNVVIFDCNDLEAKETGDLIVYGIAYTNDTKEPLKGFKAENSEKFKIGLVHGSTTELNWEGDNEGGYRKISKADIDNSNLDYIALGHFHDVLQIKSKVPCFYSGCPEPLSFKNDGGSSALLVSFSDGKVNVKPMKTNLRTFSTVEVDCTNFETDNDIRKILDKHKDDNKALRLVLKGSPSLDINLDTEFLLKEFEPKYFFLKIVDDIHLPENLSEDETIRGHFIKLVREDLKREKDPEKKKRLESALRLGVGFLDKKI